MKTEKYKSTHESHSVTHHAGGGKTEHHSKTTSHGSHPEPAGMTDHTDLHGEAREASPTGAASPGVGHDAHTTVIHNGDPRLHGRK